MPETCLIATHDPWLIQLLKVYTEESGFQVMQAFEGQEVLPIAQQAQPAVVLLQMDLAGQTRGWEALRALKADPTTRHIPVVLISWQNLKAVDDLADGAAGYLQEPVNYETFRDALRKAGVCCPVDTGVVGAGRGIGSARHRSQSQVSPHKVKANK